LLQAEKITKRAARVGFDWERTAQVIEKIREELVEVEEVCGSSTLSGEKKQERVEEEIGDLLFAVANLARKTGVEPEVALRRATAKFSARFRKIEVALEAQNRQPAECTLAELDALWDSIKHGETQPANAEGKR
jgi:ATP diphosphatase